MANNDWANEMLISIPWPNFCSQRGIWDIMRCSICESVWINSKWITFSVVESIFGFSLLSFFLYPTMAATMKYGPKKLPITIDWISGARSPSMGKVPFWLIQALVNFSIKLTANRYLSSALNNFPRHPFPISQIRWGWLHKLCGVPCDASWTDLRCISSSKMWRQTKNASKVMAHIGRTDTHTHTGYTLLRRRFRLIAFNAFHLQCIWKMNIKRKR